MRTLDRNKQLFYYKNYLSKTPIISGGYDTGEYTLTYGDLQSAKGNISANAGTPVINAWGINVNYDRKIVMANTDINEQSILWLDGESTSNPNNYVAVAVSKSLNSVTIAVKKVR